MRFTYVVFVHSVNTTIIMHGEKTKRVGSKGYGFVDFDSEEEARKAVELLNTKELHGRQMNVEVARPPRNDHVNKPRAPPHAPPKQGRIGGGDGGDGGAEGHSTNGAGEHCRPIRGRRTRLMRLLRLWRLLHTLEQPNTQL